VPDLQYLTDYGSACANIVCGQCTDLGQTAINFCCSQANPLECFITGGGGDSNYVTTVAPDPNLAACSTALDAITTCESETPGFSNLANSDEASCLCYEDTTSWDPMAFDDPWSSCVAWASTADTSIYAELLSNEGMCASVGNILQVSASGVPASTTAAATNTANSAKSTVTSAKATPIGGSESVATATSSAAKATSSSAGSHLEMNIKVILAVQVSNFGWSIFGFANKKMPAHTWLCLGTGIVILLSKSYLRLRSVLRTLVRIHSQE
jgi:hypothetical protein